MAAVLTPTGLDPRQLRLLDDVDLHALYDWHIGKAGNDDGRMWWPNAVRRLSIDQRLELAADPERDAMWEELERKRVTDPDTGLFYFVEGYGHVQPEDGPPIPFDLWPEQREVLQALVDHLRVIILKARQLGLTWIALHLCVHLLGFDPRTPNARILCLSKHGGDATKLLARARKILSLLPPYLRLAEDAETVRSLTKLKLQGRGSMTSLAGSPEAARMETATFVLADEFGFIRNKSAQDTWQALIPTMGSRGRAAVISTGNGPEQAPGDGQAFAKLWRQANGAQLDDSLQAPADNPLHPIFLASSVHPDRDEAWHESKRREFIDDEDFYTEYPETEEQALAGKAGTKVYLPAGINAAERLGAKYDELLFSGELIPSGEGWIDAAVDWGEFTHMLPIWPLENGGIYVPPGEVDGGGHMQMSVRDSTLQFLENIEPWQAPPPEHDEEPITPFLIAEWRYDAAGVESMHTLVEVVEENAIHRFITKPRWKKQLKKKVASPIVNPVPFNKRKNLTKDYLRWLFRRTANGETTRIIAISPHNRVLLRQLRGLELMDDGSGRIVKGDDHGPDTLIVGASPVAERFQSLVPADKLPAGGVPVRTA